PSARRAAESARRLMPGLTVELLDLTRFDERERAYDAIVLGEVLEHISVAHLPGILRGLRASLTEGGVVVITTPNLHGLAVRLRDALGAAFLHDPVPSGAMGWPHINLLSARMLGDVARNEGLDVVAVEFHDFTSRARARRSARMRAAVAVRAATVSALAP